MQGRRAQRGHHPNGPGHGHQGAFAGFIKQAEQGKVALELQKFFVPNPLARGLKGFDHQLQVPAPFVDRNLGTGLDHDAVVQIKVDQSGCAAKHGAAQLSALIFQGKVTVSTAGSGEIGDFPLDLNGVEAR